MNRSLRANVSRVVTQHLGQLQTQLSMDTVRIARNAIPHSGSANGWLTQLPNMLIERCEASLLSLIDDLSGFNNNGLSSKDLTEVRTNVLDGYFNMIGFAINLSEFQSLFLQR